MSVQDLEQLTLFREDSLASPSARPGNEGARRMTVISGQRCLGLYPRSGRTGSSVKMLMDCFQQNLLTRLKASLTDWKKTDITQECTVMRLRRWVPITGAEERLLWPTPNSVDYKSTAKSLKTIDSRHQQHWNMIVLREHYSKTDAYGRVNPCFGEWLMGFPIGWTDLNA